MSVTLKKITAFENEQQSGAACVIKCHKKSPLNAWSGLMVWGKGVDCILYLRGQKLYHWCSCVHGKVSMINLTDSFILDSIYFTFFFFFFLLLLINYKKKGFTMSWRERCALSPQWFFNILWCKV